MDRLLFNGQSYDRLSPTALSEPEFEKLIEQDAASVFPDYFVTQFKAPVSDGRTTKRPDLVLIEKHLRTWWVVEVELSTHSLTSHVLPQVEVFVSGIYTKHHSASIAANLGSVRSFEQGRLNRMITGQQPGVLVAIDRSVPHWEPQLHQYGASVRTIEVYRSGRNMHALRVLGDELPPYGDYISKLYPDRTVRRLVRIAAPGALPLEEPSLFVRYAGAITEWRLVRTADGLWLCPATGSNPLQVGRTYALYQEDSDLYYIRRA